MMSFLVTRHTNFVLSLNIVNIYGEQEEIENRWGRILNEIKNIERRNELILILGDVNKHIGNDELGKEGNQRKISYDGELIRGCLLYTSDAADE